MKHISEYLKGVRTTPMLKPDLHLVGRTQGILRGEDSDALAIARAKGFLRQGGEIPKRCCGRCVDCGCESGMEESK
jgi:hypothetical protein